MGAAVKRYAPHRFGGLGVGQCVRVDLDEGVVRRVVHNRNDEFGCAVQLKVSQQRLGHRLMVAVGGCKMWGRGADANVCIAVGPHQFVAVAGGLPVGLRARQSRRPNIDVERSVGVVDHNDFLKSIVIDVVNHRCGPHGVGRTEARSPGNFCIVS